jgi:hypothetical protein
MRTRNIHIKPKMKVGLILMILLTPFIHVAGQDRTAEIKLDFSEEEGKKLITATVVETFEDSL